MPFAHPFSVPVSVLRRTESHPRRAFASIDRLQKCSTIQHMEDKPEVVRHRPLVTVTIDRELLERLEDYRYENRIPSRAATFERVLRAGLSASSCAV